MLNIPQYQLLEKLHESNNALVYRAHRQSDENIVVLKVLKGTHPSPERIAQFRREYDIIQTLDITGVAKAESPQQLQGYWTMCLQDFGAYSLEQLQWSGQMTISEFLPLAIEIATILAQIHQRYVIHKDITPSNIVVNPESKQVKIIDFGISTVLSRENTTFRNPNVLEGTLTYISPEQTGRMNRAIDYRTDLYSLGITLYQLLIGHPPFTSQDPLELVHAHIAQQPIPPHEINPHIPLPISQIVLKLLGKNAEDRYQSATGLRADLEVCQQQWQGTGTIQPFALGQHDVSEHFQISQKLYGRQTEIGQLLTAFAQVSQGQSKITLITGYAGIGKSALVQEVYKPITAQRGYFISGKFEQFQRNIPYAALLQAFRSLVQQLLTEDDSVIAAWQQKLLTAVGPNGRVLIDVIPDMEHIIGPQPSVPDLPPHEAQNRFDLVFRSFIQVFTSPEHPLVIFLDDLQWADGASLKLLELLTTAEAHYLFVVGAYRDNEVHDTHPLQQTLTRIEEYGETVETIALKPLIQSDVEQLLADALHNSRDDVASLAQLVTAKTGGNPFFINEFLKALYAETLITFNHQTRAWEWTLSQIQAKEITDNVVDLMASKVQNLPSETQAILNIAACIGNQFDLKTLAAIYEETENVTATHLWPSLTEGFVIPLSDHYKLITVDVPGLPDSHYKFAHDRVQQAVYSLLTDDYKEVTHWRVGQYLLHYTDAEVREEQLFNIVNQLNDGRSQVKTDTQSKQLVELNLQAGRRAKQAAAFNPAFDYLQVGLSFLPTERSWQEQYDLTLAFYVETATAAYLSGHFEEAYHLSEVVLTNGRSLLDKIRAYEVKIQTDYAQLKTLDGLQTGFTILRLLDIELPEQPQLEDIMQSMQEVSATLGEKSIPSLIDLPQMIDPIQQATMRLLSTVASLTFIVINQLFPILVNKQVSLSMRWGNTVESTYAYAMYGLVLCASGQHETGYAFGELAMALVQKLNAKEWQAKVYLLYSLIRHHKHALSDMPPLLLEGYQSGLETGDLEMAANLAASYCHVLYFSSANLLETKQEIAKYGQVIARMRQEITLNWHKIYWQGVLNLIESRDEPGLLVGDIYNEIDMEPHHIEIKDISALTHLYTQKLILYYRFGQFSQAVACADKLESYSANAFGTFLAPPIFFYDALSRLATLPNLPEEEHPAILQKIEANQGQIATLAQLTPMNYQHQYHLIEAERQRFLGNEGAAQEQYELAITLAQKHHFLCDEALAYELAGHFYLATQRERLARYHLQDALYTYQQWGAKAKVVDLQKKYAHLWRQETSTPTITTSSTDSTTSFTLDLASVLKASQAISSEIHLDSLLAKMMGIAMENAGAQKGFLLLEQGGEWIVEAEGDIEAIKVRQSIPINETFLPLSIINYVSNTQENVVVDDATQAGRFAQDKYIITQAPKSVLCVPLVNQGKLTGLLYLENNLTTGAFTPNRVEILNLLSAPTAVSIENARLYSDLQANERKLAEYNRTLERRVAERTQELSQTVENLKTTQIQLEAARLQAEAANRAKSVFLANMSHELRTPLNGILGYAQILKRQPLLNPQQNNGLRIIQQSGDHLLNLINDILDLAKIESGKMDLYLTDFHLPYFLRGISDIIQIRAEDKGIYFQYQPYDFQQENIINQLPTGIRGDEKRLRQILINLLGNAVKFTDQGGVTLRVGPTAPPTAEQVHLRFQVADSGVGIAPDELIAIFEAFQQVGDQKKHAEGTGLGLAISYNLVQMMGGQLEVTSQPGQGTTFWFDINLQRASNVVETVESQTGLIIGMRGEQRKILIVDDKRENRGVLTELLTPIGFEIREAIDGRDALAKALEFLPDAIITDLLMPGMNGFELIQQIRQTSSLKEIAVIATSASVYEEDIQRSLAVGSNAFLPKPVESNQLFTELQQLLDVTWIYEAQTEDAINKTKAPIVPPEATELNHMLQLAMMGDVAALAERANILGADDSLQPFSAELLRLTESLQIGKIRKFLQQFT